MHQSNKERKKHWGVGVINTPEPGLAMAVPHSLAAASPLACAHPQFAQHSLYWQCHGSRQPHAAVRQTDRQTSLLLFHAAAPRWEPEERALNAEESPSSADLTGRAKAQLSLGLPARQQGGNTPVTKAGVPVALRWARLLSHPGHSNDTEQEEEALADTQGRWKSLFLSLSGRTPGNDCSPQFWLPSPATPCPILLFLLSSPPALHSSGHPGRAKLGRITKHNSLCHEKAENDSSLGRNMNH